MRIALFISSLKCGGAEKALTGLANELSDAGHDVTVLSWDHGAEKPFFSINPSVKLVPLSLTSEGTTAWAGLRNNVKRIRRIREQIKSIKPAVIISFLERVNILTSLAAIGTGLPVIVSERIDPYFYPSEKVWRLLRLCAYLFAKRIVVQTERAKSYFPFFLRSKILIIPNVVLRPSHPDKITTRPTGHIVAMGRLAYQKGFDLLIEAIAKIAPKFPGLKVSIIGDGPEKKALLSLRDSKGLTDKIHFTGQLNNPTDLLQQATLFVFPSRFEGFPNALAEAMAMGLPVVASDCSGNRDLVRAGIDGEIFPVNDVERLALALTYLLQNETIRSRYAQAAKEVVERFSLERNMTSWNQVINDVKIIR